MWSAVDGHGRVLVVSSPLQNLIVLMVLRGEQLNVTKSGPHQAAAFLPTISRLKFHLRTSNQDQTHACLEDNLGGGAFPRSPQLEVIG